MIYCLNELRSNVRIPKFVLVTAITCCPFLHAITGNVRIWNLLEDPIEVESTNKHCIYASDQFSQSQQVPQRKMFVSTISSRYFCLGYSSIDFVFSVAKDSKPHKIGAVTAMLRSGYSGMGGWSKTRKKLRQKSIDFHLFPAQNKELSEWSDVNFTIVVFRKRPTK